MSGWRRVQESDAWLDPERVNVSPPLGTSSVVGLAAMDMYLETS